MVALPLLALIAAISLAVVPVHGLQNLFKPLSFGGGPMGASPSTTSLEDQLVEAISNEGNRLANSDSVASLISRLESQNPTNEPAISPLVYGRWRLLYTNNADTSSPVQRSAVNAQKYTIYQDIIVNDNEQLQVNQVVQFSDKIQLSVDALASTAAYPLAELTERQSGTTLGLSILGVSLVGEEAQPDPNRPNSRINFVFDEGNFDFGGDFRIPYPVPFRLPILRDAVKGWIDITYLSDRLRIAKGNKGTTFVLLKE